MAVNKVVYNENGTQKTLIDLTGDTVTQETLAKGVTAHAANGEVIEGTMKTETVLYVEQSLTDAQKAQARTNIGAASTEEVSELSEEIVYLNTQTETNKNGITALQKELEDLISAKAEGNTLEEQIAWLNANGDPTKEYLLMDGNYYKAEYQTTEGEKVPNFTNILEGATISLNKRYNSSDTLKDATGYIAIDHIAVKSNDVIRINDVNVISSSAGSNRVKYYNSSKSAITTYTGNDARADQLLKLTKSNGVMSWVVGYYNTSLGNDSTNTLPSQASGIAYMRANLYISSATITEADIANLIMTKNQEITYTTLEGETIIVWVKSGNTSSSVDYGKRVSALETTTADHEVRIKSLELGNANSMTVFAPSPQLPADGTSNADFNASDMGCDDIYSYIDALVSKYPRFITKETLGKDASNTYDWNRYVCARRTYDAWQKVNYPPMYAWVNGSTTIYSVSVSPRIGDTLYTTTYIGTSKGTVTAVSNANQTRTVGGVVYTRNKAKDIEPTLVYTQTAYSPCYVGAYAGHKNGVYNSSQSKIGTISAYTSSNMTDSNGVSYIRHPLGDRNEYFETIPTIVLGANEHGGNVNGDPREPAIVTSRMIKDLCECVNANNPFLNMLKNDYMIVFCPIINPYGFTQSTYENANGINIDRNFDTTGWGNDTSSGSAQGTYGGSENETQYFMNTLVASKTKIALANHCLGSHLNTTTGESANAGMCHWMLGRNNSKYNNHLNSIGASMSANYNLSFTDYGQAPCESYAKTRSYIDSIGAEGGAVEMNAREGFVLAGEGNLHTARILEADYTLLLQFLHMLIECQAN